MSKYRILSIDGGGIRGVITTILLERIIATSGLEDFLDSVDLVAGTSTGGLLALAIAKPLDLSEIKSLYIEKGPVVFDDSWVDDLVDLGRLRGAEYSIEPLRHELEERLEDKELGDLEKHVLITTFDLDNNKEPSARNWKPKLFHNFPGENSDRDILARDVGLYTSAAPTFFPSVDGYIDGGVYAGNPSMCALAQTQDERYPPNPKLDDIVLFSMGTGTNLQYIQGESHDWGEVQWVKPLINLMFDGVAGVADYQCQQILGERYHRLDPVFPPGIRIPMDAVNKIDYMRGFAETLPIEETIEWLKQMW
jgi:uncharacterized protein